MNLFGGVIPVTGTSFLVFCVFAIAVIGFALGRITIKGVSLGDAGVFIIALLFGALCFAPLQAQLMAEEVSFAYDALEIVENLGLVLFVTAVGFIAGPKFFGNMKKNFKSYVLLGLIIIVSGGLAAVACVFVGKAIGFGSTIDSLDKFVSMIVGLLGGALTSTPAFSAAKATSAYPELVTVGYGIAYIFGVIGVVLFVQLMPKITKADMDAERAKITQVESGEQRKSVVGKLLELDEHGFGAFALAVVVGTLIGKIKIPLTAAGLDGTCFSLTTTGGCLLTALIFGHFGRIGKLSIMPKQGTLKIFRELGLMFFLIGAGIPGGADFVANFDIMYFVYGAFMTVAPMVIGYFFARFVLKMNLLNILGSITGGMTSTPALGTLISVAKTEDVAAAYAATYPIALIAVVLVSQFLIILF